MAVLPASQAASLLEGLFVRLKNHRTQTKVNARRVFWYTSSMNASENVCCSISVELSRETKQAPIPPEGSITSSWSSEAAGTMVLDF